MITDDFPHFERSVPVSLAVFYFPLLASLESSPLNQKVCIGFALEMQRTASLRLIESFSLTDTGKSPPQLMLVLQQPCPRTDATGKQ